VHEAGDRGTDTERGAGRPGGDWPAGYGQFTAAREAYLRVVGRRCELARLEAAWRAGDEGATED
jgi:hypothetical protein